MVGLKKRIAARINEELTACGELVKLLKLPGASGTHDPSSVAPIPTGYL